MQRAHSLLATLVPTAALLAGPSGGQTLEALDVSATAARIGGSTLAYTVEEQDAGDLNGDGQVAGAVLHLTDLETGAVSNLGLAVTSELRVDGGLVAFSVVEADQGPADLNGDGDIWDVVAHVHDLATDQTSNLGLSLSSPSGKQMALADGRLLFLSVERSIGLGEPTDLNGDGDVFFDNVLHVWDARTQTTRNVGLAGALPLTSGRTALMSVKELAQGALDRNGDGDAVDLVLARIDLATGAVTNLGQAGFAHVLSPTLALLSSSEIEQGAQDLNGDGDVGTFDVVLLVLDLQSDALTFTGVTLASTLVEAGDTHAAVVASEPFGGATDLNGDGDAVDRVLALVDLATGAVRSLGLASSPSFRASGPTIAFRVDEADQGADLNGDGDLQDHVLHVQRTDSGALENLGLAATVFPVVTPGLVVFGVSETSQGADVDGDGSTAGTVTLVRDVQRGTTTVTGLRATTMSLAETSGSRVLLWSHESLQGAGSLNGDSDVQDQVLFLFDRATGKVRNTGLAAMTGTVSGDGRRFVFRVFEAAHGQDLTGDGDTADFVPFLVGP